MQSFSLIVATLGRTEELKRLLHSLAKQQMTDLEVIIVDQNDDNRVDQALSEIKIPAPVTHLRQNQKNVSMARNTGLARASGEIIAFPDDDCWYPDGLLPQIRTWFENNGNYDILAVGALDENGIPSGNRWIQDRCDISPLNALRTTFCNSLFLRRKVLPAYILFDESQFFGEETDYILRLIKNGLKGRFDRTWHVFHPRRDMLSGTVSLERAFKYGHGMGQLVRRRCNVLLWMGLLSYDIFRALSTAMRGNSSDLSFCLSHAKGLFNGYLADATPQQPMVPANALLTKSKAD
jgi:glycosyltransferase involved in cell wall biosynthesis